MCRKNENEVLLLQKEDVVNDIQIKIARYNATHIDTPISVSETYQICGMISTLSEILRLFGYDMILITTP